MIEIFDYKKRKVRFSLERKSHLHESHPEMLNQDNKIEETLKTPDCVIKSNTDFYTELYYKLYKSTPVGTKYLCVVVKHIGVSVRNNDDNFIITAYFTDAIKKGELLWKKK